MTQENKELLLRDLSARLPYGVKCNVPYLKDIRALACIQYDAENTLFDFWDNNESYCRLQLFLSEFKPYLFPLSSMTDEMLEELNANGFFKYRDTIANVSHLENNGNVSEEIYTYIDIENISFLMEFFYSHHIDFRGLIEKGLAIDATGLGIY